jgi:UDP-glucose 4-epimerase
LSESNALDDRAFNVGTNVGTSVIGLADALESVAGVSPGRKHENERPGELRHSTLNTAKIRSHGWAPAHSLEQGLHATYTHIKNQAAGASE